MAQELERTYVHKWRETGRLLDDIRWQELRALADEDALKATTSLIAAACLVPLPAQRRTGSGLVDLQDRLHRRR